MNHWRYYLRAAIASSVIFLAACGGSSSDAEKPNETRTPENVATPSPTAGTPTTTPEAPAKEEPAAPQVSLPNKVDLKGVLTYDRVLFDDRLFKGLDYNKTLPLPIRGATVQLLDGEGNLVAQTQSDAVGQYRFTVAQGSEVRVRVLAELLGRDNAAWDIRVRDNTKGSALYVLEGSLAGVGAGAGQSRDMHAPSGWDGQSYASARSAAPFAILDSIYDAIDLVVAADPQVVLPPLNVFWSENNIAASGRLQDGRIGTSFYTGAGPSIYLLGAADNDADEYDRAVVQHEFAHYLEHQLGRSENIGGSHNTSSKLDMRVAFSEAWGNAFSAMASGNPHYRDSMGKHQAQGFTIDVENKSYGRSGWFSEGSIQGIFYDLYDAHPDGSDAIELGFKPIYDALLSEQYANFDGIASIYPLIALLKEQHAHQAQAMTHLLKDHDIHGEGWFGEGEVNDGGFDGLLPVYQSLVPGGETQVCSNRRSQEYNGVDVRRFVKIDISASGRYQLRAVKSGGDMTSTNPQLRLLRKGSEFASSHRSTRDSEGLTLQLPAGTYVLEVYEATNSDQDAATGGLACFTVSVN